MQSYLIIHQRKGCKDLSITCLPEEEKLRCSIKTEVIAHWPCSGLGKKKK